MKAAKRFLTLIMTGILTLQAIAPAAADELMPIEEELMFEDEMVEDLVEFDEEDDWAEISDDEMVEEDLFADEEEFWADDDLLIEDDETEEIAGCDFLVMDIPSETVVNPLYAGLVDFEAAPEEAVEAEMDEEEEAELLEEYASLAVADLAADGNYCTTISEAAAQAKQHFINRDTKFVIQYKAAAYSKTIAKDIMAHIFDHTGNPKEGDYLQWQYENWNSSGRASMSGGYCYMTLTYNVSYLSTKAQEDALDAAMASLIPSLKASCSNDYQKIKAVYDYICNNVHYDYVSATTERSRYTAYGALINHACVCQGYALLTYRMMLEMGIDCRMITGYGYSDSHAWDIVKLNGSYYNVDTTWDADTKGFYSCFLRSDANLVDHTKESKFYDASFTRAYPISSKDFALCTRHTVVNDPAKAATCTANGLTQGSHCSTCGMTLTEQKVVLAHGHVAGKVSERVEATSTQPGMTEKYACIYCGTYISGGEIIPATGETVNNETVNNDGIAATTPNTENVTVNNGTVNTGTVNNETANNGGIAATTPNTGNVTVNNGTVNNGTVNNETANNGGIAATTPNTGNVTVNNGAVNNETANNGTVNNETANNGGIAATTPNTGNVTVNNGTVNNGTVNNGTVNNGTVNNGTANNGGIAATTPNTGNNGGYVNTVPSIGTNEGYVSTEPGTGNGGGYVTAAPNFGTNGGYVSTVPNTGSNAGTVTTVPNFGSSENKAPAASNNKPAKPAHTHGFTNWKVVTNATITSTGLKKRTCIHCKQVQTAVIPKLAPTAKVSKTKVTLKKGKKVAITVSGMAQGDCVVSWKVKNKKIASVTSKGVIKGKKKGKTTVTITLKSGLVKTVAVKVK